MGDHEGRGEDHGRGGNTPLSGFRMGDQVETAVGNQRLIRIEEERENGRARGGETDGQR